MNRDGMCAQCEGSGMDAYGVSDAPCDVCGGSGRVASQHDETVARQARTLASATCPLCGGRIYTGTIRDAWSEGGTLREVRQCAGCGAEVADVPACEIQGELGL